MDWIWIILGALFLLNTIQLRSFLSSVKLINNRNNKKEPTDIDILYTSGVDKFTTDEQSMIAGYMGKNKIKILDIIPEKFQSSKIIDFANKIKSHKENRHRFDPGYTAGYAVAVSTEILNNIGYKNTHVLNHIPFCEQIKKIKNYAVTSMDYAIILGKNVSMQFRVTHAMIMLHDTMKIALWIKIVILGLVFVGPFVSPCYGTIAFALFHFQPLIVIIGTKFHPFDPFTYSLFRFPIELYNAISMLFKHTVFSRETERIKALSPVYAKILQTDPNEFFNARQEKCPICQNTKLISWIKTSDMLQNKPGKFTLEKCKNCGHIFQNPRLSLKGLDFYYKDFYDGLGKESTNFVFGTMVEEYLNRAKYFKKHIKEIDSWLDVGLGQGHFCNVATDLWPYTCFDGLDFSDCVEEAKQRGWITNGYSGLFTELVGEFPEHYTVVSMFHYLEHTLDPRIELDAAYQALAPQGYLIIESPNPESIMGKILGRFWLTWFQPQHLNFLSAKNLEKILNDIGFTKVSCEYTVMHRRVDLASALWIFLNWIAPQSNKPWRKTSTPGKIWRNVVTTLAFPVLICLRIIDKTTYPLNRGKYLSNTFRFVAKKG